MSDDRFIVVDNVLPLPQQDRLYNSLRRIPWTCEWSSAIGRLDFAWHWNHTFHEYRQNMPPMSEQEYQALRDKYPLITPLWDSAKEIIKEKLGKYDILRFYSNCNPYGTNAYVHVDDGEYTMIYYPALEWNPEWEGGTAFYKIDEEGRYDAIKYVSYKPNRMVLFPGHIPHRGMPVDRQCTAPRYVIAMKLQRDVNDPGYLRDFYKKGK